MTDRRSDSLTLESTMSESEGCKVEPPSWARGRTDYPTVFRPGGESGLPKGVGGRTHGSAASGGSRPRMVRARVAPV